jgi:hypothetical protein
VKPRIARVCLAVAVVFFFGGFMMLCACPGVYALAAAFAGVAAWAGAGRTRGWSKVVLVACLIATVADTLDVIREHRREELERVEETQTHATNEPKPQNASTK